MIKNHGKIIKTIFQGGSMMRTKKLYTFDELNESAQREASYKMQEKLGPTEEWQIFNEDITESIVWWVKENTEQEKTNVEWHSDAYDNITLYSFNPPISEKQAKKQLNKTNLELLEEVEKLPYVEIDTDRNGDDQWETTFEINQYGVEKKDIKAWLSFLRKHRTHVSSDFEEEWKNMRYEDRLNSVVDYSEETEEYLVEVVEDVIGALGVFEKVDLAYVEAYEEVRKEAESKIEKQVKYYNSNDYYLDGLRDGVYENYGYLVDGTPVDLESDLKLECEECFEKERIKDMAYTENHGKVALICNECAATMNVKVS